MRAGLWPRIRSEPRPRTIRHQFGADDRHLARGVDPQPHLPPLKADHGDADVITNVEFFHELSSQHEHVSRPYANLKLWFQPTFEYTGDYVSRIPGSGAYQESRSRLRGRGRFAEI